jgi:hypothetical protein
MSDWQRLGDVGNAVVTDARRRLDNAQAEVEFLTIEERAIFFGELKGYGREKSYKPGYAASKFKARFGEWPSREIEATPELECSDATRRWISATMHDFWRSKKRKA